MRGKAIIAYDAHVLGEPQRVNSQFSKVRIRVCYEGINRRNEVISKETLTRMAENTLRNVPIVGHYLPEVNNFGGHDIALEESGNELKLKSLTQAYGVVPESTEFKWETVTEKNGMTTHEYLTCDGILWTGRYPTECECILDNGMNQSMELCVNRWGLTADGYDEILDGEFAALCILGKSTDPSINVEPCYEKAGIESYSLDDAVAELVRAYKASLEEPEVVVTAEPETVVEAETYADDDDATEEHDEDEEHDEYEQTDEEDQTEEESAVESDDEDEDAVADESDDGEVEEALEVTGVEVEEAFELTDHADAIIEEEPDYRAMAEEATAQLSAVREELASANVTIADLTVEVEALRAYRHEVESSRVEAETREEFADLSGDPDFEGLLENIEPDAKEALFEKCYALRGKKNRPQPKSYQYDSVRVPIARTENEKKPFGGIVDDYKSKHNK